jgi:hypothetical protein
VGPEALAILIGADAAAPAKDWTITLISTLLSHVKT